MLTCYQDTHIQYCAVILQDIRPSSIHCVQLNQPHSLTLNGTEHRGQPSVLKMITECDKIDVSMSRFTQ